MLFRKEKLKKIDPLLRKKDKITCRREGEAAAPFCRPGPRVSTGRAAEGDLRTASTD